MEWIALGLFCAALLICIVLDLSILYALAFGLLVFLLYGRRKGFSRLELFRMAFEGIKTVRNILITFFLIGIMTALWRAAGTIPVIVCYASGLIRPSVFLLMAFLLTRPYVGNEKLTAKFGAAGGTIGTGAGVLTGLLLMLFAYYLNRDLIHRRIRSDKHDHEESYKKVVKVIFMMCTPIILATCVYNVTVIVDQVLYTHFMNMHGYNPDNISKLYGLFGFRARPIIGKTDHQHTDRPGQCHIDGPDPRCFSFGCGKIDGRRHLKSG